jgi:uncharacterized protein (TIGR00251 family)
VIPDRGRGRSGDAARPDRDRRDAAAPVVRAGDAVALAVHVQPGAPRDAVLGLHGGRFKLRVAAPACDGRANTRLREFLAREFGVPLARVTLTAGAGARLKRVRIDRPGREPPWLAPGG